MAIVGEKIIVAMTRPETMLGDSAIAVHPDDPRYKVLLPFTTTALKENNLRVKAPSGQIRRSLVR